MKYVTGIHALNMPCSLETCGDWHASSLKWANISYADTRKRFFGDYGIEKDVCIPGTNEKVYAANHIRAVLDLLEDGNFSVAQGMNRDFICNSRYDNEVFGKVYSMKDMKNWDEIDAFMGKEYFMKWENFKKGRRGHVWNDKK